MNGLMILLGKAIPKYLTDDEIKLNLPDTFKESWLGNIDFDQENIGDFYSNNALMFWETERINCIKEITLAIEKNDVISDTILIGFIGAWVNSDIDHPIVTSLVKLCIKNNLLKYPISTTVSQHIKLTNKAPSGRPIKDPFSYLETLMYYFEIKTINGVATALKSNNKTVRTNLNALVGGKNTDHQKLIDKNATLYNITKKVYEQWLKQR